MCRNATFLLSAANFNSKSFPEESIVTLDTIPFAPARRKAQIFHRSDKQTMPLQSNAVIGLEKQHVGHEKNSANRLALAAAVQHNFSRPSTVISWNRITVTETTRALL